jgi:hypothetical protein
MMNAHMTQPRCLNEVRGSGCRFQDGFVGRQNGFVAPAVSGFSGEKPEFKLIEAIANLDRRLDPEAGAFGHHLQTGAQLGAGLLDFVAQFAACEAGDGWVGQLLPGHPLRLLQRLYGLVQGIRLSHARGPPVGTGRKLAIAMLKDFLTRDGVIVSAIANLAMHTDKLAMLRRRVCSRERLPMSLSSAKNFALRAARSQDEKEAIELLSKAILELAASIEATDAKLKQINKSKG